MTPLNLAPRLLLACALLSGCSASSGPDSTAPGAGAAANPSDPSAPATPGPNAPASPSKMMPTGPIGTPPPPTAPPTRPAPQSNIRSCGAAKTVVNPLSTHVEWGSFAPVQLGASVATMVPLLTGAKTVSGSASRLSAGVTGNAGIGPDLAADSALYNLGFTTDDLGNFSQASNYNAGGATQPAGFYVSPSPTTLTFFDGNSAQEVGWSIDAPARTSVAAAPTDSFVRGVVAGMYFGIELALSFPSECAVGALSDALGRPALLRDATPASGIFAPGVTADVQKVLVANDVTMQVRVTANKLIPAVVDLLGSTTCSPASIADCATLVTALEQAAQTFQSANGASDLDQLQANTDPTWSPVLVEVAPISIANP